MAFDPWSTNKFSTKRGSNLSEDLDIFRNDLCVQWGFCNWLTAQDLLGEFGALTAEGFADQLLEAEGIDPSSKPTFRQVIQRAFVERYGGPEISIERYSNSTIT